MSTALVLMNRLRSKAREEQVTAFAAGDDLNIALLSELNQAVRIVLEERTWNFQHRSDGSLTLRNSFTETTATAGTITTSTTAMTANIVASSPETADLNGNFTASFVFTGSNVYGNTAFDLSIGRISGSSVLGVLYSNIPTDVFPAKGWLSFVYQYGLPTTVRSITEIWHQEENIEIFQESEHDFRQLIPRPHDDHGSMPRVAFIGGTITPTAATAALAETMTDVNAIRIWPIPGTRELLHYRYIKRYGDLALVTDNLNGVPLVVEDLIVQLAYARQLQSIQADLQRGMAMEAHVMGEIERKHRNNRFDAKRARTLRSLDHLGTKRSGLNRSYDTVPGWP